MLFADAELINKLFWTLFDVTPVYMPVTGVKIRSLKRISGGKNDTNPLNFIKTRIRQIVLTHTKYFVKTLSEILIKGIIISAGSDVVCRIVTLTECIFLIKNYL